MSPARIVIATFVFALFCVLVWLAPEIRSMWILWREKRAVARRRALEESWNILAYPKESRRVSRGPDPSVLRAAYHEVPSIHK